MRLLTPSIKTLAKYGLTEADWQQLKGNEKCSVCQLLPSTGRLCIDHEHVKKWSKLPPQHRKQYVRGLLCWRCNYYFAGRGMTVDRARRLADYLRRYEGSKIKEA